MICLRCGYCCYHSVVIINPNSVKEDLDLDKLKKEDLICLDGSSKCPHLEWLDNKTICKIHHYTWFKNTPCGKHGQIETNKDNVCRIGKYFQKNPYSLQKLISGRLKDGSKTI